MTSSALVIEAVSDRPELGTHLWAFAGMWPEFMTQDPMANFYYDVVDALWPEFALLAHHGDPSQPIARAFAIPFAFGSDVNREELPDGGWDTVIQWGSLDRTMGNKPTLASALEIAIRPDLRGTGLASVMLTALRNHVASLGYTELVAPVRPSAKTLEPHCPMDEYAHRTRDDGLPHDPWLRVHVRAGGDIVKVCPRAMTISGTLAEWRKWTGLPFDVSGDVEVPDALVPVHCDVTHNHAVYVEPGVWVRHQL